MKNNYWIVFGIAVLTIVMISACAPGQQPAPTGGESMMEKDDVMVKKDDAMMDDKEDDAMMEKDDATLDDSQDEMMEKDDIMMDDKESDDMMEGGWDEVAMMDDSEDTMMDDAFMASGTVLAGSASPYIAFNKADYEKAMAEGKTIVLYFYASWCPTCKAEQPAAHAAFDTLDDSDIVAFRVNYKDSDTDADEEALAKEHGITYQHTKVIVKNGERVLKSLESWDKQRYLDEMAKVA